MVLEQLARLHEIMIVKVTPLVISPVFICASSQELEPKEALVRLLVTAIEQFLTAVPRLERLLQLGDGAKAVLQGGILHLLGHFFVGT